MKPVKLFLNAACFALIAHWPVITAALSTDREQPIHIEADKLDIDESRQISIYQGNVQMQQGSLDINGDQLSIVAWINGESAEFREIGVEEIDGVDVRTAGQPAHAVLKHR